MDTPKSGTNTHGFYYSSGFERHHHHYRQHPYRSEKQYFPKEFKKAKAPTFDREMKKSQDAEAWFLGMNKLIRLHEYSGNKKARITNFSLKGKADIW